MYILYTAFVTTSSSNAFTHFSLWNIHFGWLHLAWNTLSVCQVVTLRCWHTLKYQNYIHVKGDICSSNTVAFLSHHFPQRAPLLVDIGFLYSQVRVIDHWILLKAYLSRMNCCDHSPSIVRLSASLLWFSGINVCVRIPVYILAHKLPISVHGINAHQ